MDYNINFEEDKGSYSPKSDPKDIQIQNFRLEKVLLIRFSQSKTWAIQVHMVTLLLQKTNQLPMLKIKSLHQDAWNSVDYNFMSITSRLAKRMY